MIFRSWSGKFPVKFTVCFSDANVVDARVPMRHQTVVIELPVLVPVGPVPLTLRRLELVAVSCRNPVVGKRPELFDESVIQFLRPLIFEELDDFITALQERIAVPPDAVGSIGQCGLKRARP